MDPLSKLFSRHNSLALFLEMRLSVGKEPAGCEKLDKKPAEYGHPVTYGDLVDELHPLEKFPCQKQVPIPEKESSEKTEEPTPKCSPWDLPPNHDEAVSGEHPPA